MSRFNADTGSKLAALELCLSSPDWPYPDQLSEYGKALHAAMSNDVCKKYALHIVDDQFEQALKLATTWSKPLNDFLDHDRIEGNDNNRKMVEVYYYYMNLLPVDLSKLEFPSKNRVRL